MRLVGQLALVGCAPWLLAPVAAGAADYPAPKQADWVAHDFRFHTGERMPELRIHYLTVGDPSGEPVLILHGTAGSGQSMLTPAFAGELFGPGQPLDAAKYYIILPDQIGAGQSSRPSEGLRAHFPRYDYADMVQADYRLLVEGLGIKHVRLVMGNSMGGMLTWDWAEAYPGFMDALVPMASQPTAMASRNWMMRSMLIESIRQDPAYQGGNYTSQPPSLRLANVMFSIGTNGGTLGWQSQAPTHAQAQGLVEAMLQATPPPDANDFIYQWDASRDFDAAPGLARITAPLMAINSADDERNPPETGIEVAAMKQVANGRIDLIPASAETRGHGTTGMARFYAEALRQFMAAAPHHGS